ncbi:hypothetical protein DVG80_32325 [Rhodococcus erythropolis]|nr:hypothetical protein DVG80_32325 [Rhodococcus erythropolis]
MGNLGLYQDLVTAAKQAGGVQSFLKTIQSQAVSKVAPSIYAKGYATGTGAGLALGVALTVSYMKFLDQRKADQKVAEEAKAQLASEIAVLEGEAGDDGSQPD